jgi:hypothetical protein
MQQLCELCIKYGLIVVGIGVTPYHTVIYVLDSQKDMWFSTYNRKLIFYTKKWKFSFGNIIWNGKIHLCNNFRLILMNYTMKMEN